jgi:hypothetical protein
MRFGAKKHPIDRLSLRRIGQQAERCLDSTVRAFQRKARQRLTRASQNLVPSGCGESAGRSAANRAKSHDRDGESLCLCRRCHCACSSRSGEKQRCPDALDGNTIMRAGRKQLQSRRSRNEFSQSLFAQSRKWRSALASQSMTGERVEQNASRDYERHHQKRCEKSCIVTAIDIALTGHEPT